MGDQKGELSGPATVVEPSGKKKDSFPGKDSANEKSWTLCLLAPSQLRFPLHRSILLPLLCRDLGVARCSCRLQIAIFC